MGKLFGTDGVRGIINKELTVDLALKLGKAIGTYFGKNSNIMIGRDARAGGDMFMRVVEGAMLSTGVNVYEAGYGATPALQYGVKTLGYDGGVIVTASHNPPEYNGIKVLSNQGIEIEREEESKIEEIYFEDRFNSSDWTSLKYDVRKETRVLDTYVKGILSHVDVEKVRKKGYRVLIDSANSVGGLATPLVARELGCRVFTLNGNLDPLFPARYPEPTFESLHDTAEVAKALKVDLGVTHDGDADRAIFIDSEGTIQWGDRSAALLSYWAHMKNPNLPPRVFTAVSSSSLVEEFLTKFGLEVRWTKVGSVDIAHTLMKEKGVAGFEENGGFMYPPHQYVRDGAMSMALMLELMASENETSSSLFKRLPAYHLVKTKVRLNDNINIEKIYKELENKYAGVGKMITIDGVKVTADDYWFLVRKSGTEPIIRVLVEAKDVSKASKIADELVSFVGGN